MVHHRNFHGNSAMTGRFRRSRRETAGLAGRTPKRPCRSPCRAAGARRPHVARARCPPRRRAPRRRSDHRCERRRHECRRVGAGLAGRRDRRGAQPARNLLALGERRRVRSPAQRGLLDLVLGFWHNQAWMDMITRSFGPYQTNPLNINPFAGRDRRAHRL